MTHLYFLVQFNGNFRFCLSPTLSISNYFLGSLRVRDGESPLYHKTSCKISFQIDHKNYFLPVFPKNWALNYFLPVSPKNWALNWSFTVCYQCKGVRY